jgi:hypothetical protein
MKKSIATAMLVLCASSPLLATVVWQDDFESETVGEEPANWTKSSQWGAFEIANESGNKVMASGIWNGKYTIASNASFADLNLATSWTISWDHYCYQQGAAWSIADTALLPGNFKLSKHQRGGFTVLDGDGSTLGTTDTLKTANSDATDPLWTAYSVTYDAVAGTLTIDGSNSYGEGGSSIHKVLSGAAANYTANDKIIFGTADTSADQDMNIDNVVVDAVPEPATMGLLAAGGLLLLRRKRL